MKNILIQFNKQRSIERDLYFMFGVSKIDLELLTSLGVLIINTGKDRHNKDKIFKNATPPKKIGQFLASFDSLINRGFIDKVKARNGHHYLLTPDGLMILERFEMALSEINTKTDRSINDIITGALN